MPATARPGQTQRRPFVFRIALQGTPGAPIEISAHLFDRSGALIASAPLKNGQVEFAVSDAGLRRARLVFGSTIPKERLGKRAPTLDIMAWLKAHEPALRLERDKRDDDLLAIPELHWRGWPWCRCHVRGRVVKPIDTGGVRYDVPVCNARVHICEVDRIALVIPRLPDRDIWRLRDDLRRGLEQRVPCDQPRGQPVTGAKRHAAAAIARDSSVVDCR